MVIKKKITGRAAIVAVVALCGMWLALMTNSCRFEQKHAPMILVSVQPQKELLKRIAGSRYEVHCMLGDESNPDNFEPNANNMMWLEGCEAYFAIGNIGYESAIMTRIDDVKNKVKVFDNTKGLDFIEFSPAPGMREKNPYVWVSAKNCKLIAKNMLDALIEMNPKNTRYFTHRYNKLKGELDAVDNALTATLDTCRGAAFVEALPKLAYFARDYKLRDVALLPSLDGTVAPDKVEACRESGAKVFFVQQYTGDRKTADYGTMLGLKTVRVNLVGESWLDGLQMTAKTIARNR